MKSVKPQLQGFIVYFTVTIVLDMKQYDVYLADKIEAKVNPDYNIPSIHINFINFKKYETNKRNVGLPDGWNLTGYDTCHLNFEFEISHLPTQDEIDETKNRLSAIIDEIRKETK